MHLRLYQAISLSRTETVGVCGAGLMGNGIAQIEAIVENVDVKLKRCTVLAGRYGRKSGKGLYDYA